VGYRVEACGHAGLRRLPSLDALGDLVSANISLSPKALACLRKMVAWSIVGKPSLQQETLDREFGRKVWEEVAAARPKLMKSGMYGCDSLTAHAVSVAMGWPE
jgi:hypothetical protein